MAGDDQPFDSLDPAWELAFEQAWRSWCAGSMAIGAAIVDQQGDVVSTGRNRVLEGAGSGPVAGALIAHAEMDAFASLGHRLGDKLSLYTTVSPCLMCTATAIALRIGAVHVGTEDPVFEGLDDALSTHPYCAGRIPARERLRDARLCAMARLLPMTARVWSRPGVAPRPEWLRLHADEWATASDLIQSGLLSKLAVAKVSVRDVYEALRTRLDTLVTSG
jgi:tRNA(Arg) A34 adenosine deaminase TadA